MTHCNIFFAKHILPLTPCQNGESSNQLHKSFSTCSAPSTYLTEARPSLPGQGDTPNRRHHLCPSRPCQLTRGRSHTLDAKRYHLAKPHRRTLLDLPVHAQEEERPRRCPGAPCHRRSCHARARQKSTLHLVHPDHAKTLCAHCDDRQEPGYSPDIAIRPQATRRSLRRAPKAGAAAAERGLRSPVDATIRRSSLRSGTAVARRDGLDPAPPRIPSQSSPSPSSIPAVPLPSSSLYKGTLPAPIRHTIALSSPSIALSSTTTPPLGL